MWGVGVGFDEGARETTIQAKKKNLLVFFSF